MTWYYPHYNSRIHVTHLGVYKWSQIYVVLTAFGLQLCWVCFTSRNSYQQILVTQATWNRRNFVIIMFDTHSTAKWATDQIIGFSQRQVDNTVIATRWHCVIHVLILAYQIYYMLDRPRPWSSTTDGMFYYCCCKGRWFI